MTPIKKLSDFESGIFEDAVRSNAEHGLGYTDMNDHLLQMFEDGDIEAGLIREEWISAGISPVRQVLRASGVRLSGLRASSCGVFFRADKNYVKGADVVFPILLQEMFETGLGLQASTGGGVADLSVVSGTPAAGDSLYPLDVRQPVDQRLPYPANMVSIDDLVTLTTGVDSGGYKSAQINRVTGDTELERVTEGSDLPLYEIKLGDATIYVYKYGGRWKITYEAIRRQKINQLQILVQNMAFDENLRRIKAALAVARNGDGNGNAAITTTLSDNAWSIRNVDEFGMSVAYNSSLGMNMYVGDLAEVKNVRALRYTSTPGMVLTPEQLAMYGGAGYQMPDGSPLKLGPKGSIMDGSGSLLGWNTARALEEVIENGSQIQEQARNIANQTQEYTTSLNMGYAKPWVNSFQVLAHS